MARGIARENAPKPRRMEERRGLVLVFCEASGEFSQSWLYGPATQARRDFVHVGDVVRANLLATERPLVAAARGTLIADLAFNVSSGVGVPIYEGAKQGDIRHSALSSAKAEEVLGFRPEIPLARGLQATAGWSRSA